MHLIRKSTHRYGGQSNLKYFFQSKFCKGKKQRIIKENIRCSAILLRIPQDFFLRSKYPVYQVRTGYFRDVDETDFKYALYALPLLPSKRKYVVNILPQVTF